MMKRVLAILLTAAVGFSMAACSKGTGGTGKTPAAADVVKAVSEKMTFTNEMMMVDADQFGNLYRIDLEKVEDKAILTDSSRATAEEITVIRMKDAKDVQIAKDAITEHIEDQRRSFEGYIEGEIPKLDNALVMTEGAYVILVVAPDTAPAEAAFQSQLK